MRDDNVTMEEVQLAEDTPHEWSILVLNNNKPFANNKIIKIEPKLNYPFVMVRINSLC